RVCPPLAPIAMGLPSSTRTSRLSSRSSTSRTSTRGWRARVQDLTTPQLSHSPNNSNNSNSNSIMVTVT
ncbi:unnamed protein product, partial [Sphagnum jensenii]